MEKEPQPESMSTVTIKPEYAPSEVYSSEPPPAYHRPQSSAVQVAKIIAVTVVLVSVVLGSFILASAYVTANASCRQLEQELELLSEAADRFQPPPQAEALIQEAPLPVKHQSDPLLAEESQKDTKEIETNNIDNDADSNSDRSSDSSDKSVDSSESNESEEEERIHLNLPLQFDFDDIAGAIIDKNQKSRMNCIMEKKSAEEVVDHKPKTIRLPFGVNLTTDPRLERLSGERMIIVCESGHFQKTQPPAQPQPEEEDEEDTIMIQPVMIPIPHTSFQTHMPQQMQPIMQQQEPQTMPMRAPMNPMHPMETMRPPMPPMIQPQVQIQPQPQPQPQQNEFPPNPILHHIVQQIIAQKIMESEKAREEQQQQQQQQQQAQPQPQLQEMHTVVDPRPQHRFQAPQSMAEQRFPIPEEVLTQLNRLPNRDVIVTVSEPESEENSQEMRFVQEQRQNAAEMNGRQAYARGIPLHIPVQMLAQEQEQQQEPEQEQEPQAVASEETRPHYVQPRSVRSVDALLKKDQKRVRRCACDCAC